MVCSLVSNISIVLKFAINKNKLYTTLGYWSRDMHNSNFSEKGLGLVSSPHFMYHFSRKMFLSYILLTNQIPLSNYHYFSRYWTIRVLQLFGNQDVTSWNLKLTLAFLSSSFARWPKSQDKNLSILGTKRAFDVKFKIFFNIFKGLSATKICFRPESAPLNWNHAV